MHISGTQCDIYTYMQFTLIKSILLSLLSHTLLNTVQKIDRIPKCQVWSNETTKRNFRKLFKTWVYPSTF